MRLYPRWASAADGTRTPRITASGQGDLFPGLSGADDVDDTGVYADTVGLDSARAAKRGRGQHKYPKSKFSSVGEVTGAVLGDVFGGGAAIPAGARLFGSVLRRERQRAVGSSTVVFRERSIRAHTERTAENFRQGFVFVCRV